MIFLTTVVFPEPVPPAIPIINIVLTELDICFAKVTLSCRYFQVFVAGGVGA